MARLTVKRLFVPILERGGGTDLAARLRRRSRAPLGEIARRLDERARSREARRRGAVMPRDIPDAFRNAVNAALAAREGAQAKWNWCGGELGLAVCDAIRVAGESDWSGAFQILEAGIDAGPDGQPGDLRAVTAGPGGAISHARAPARETA